MTALASAQWGVMHLDQLNQLGLTARAVQQRAAICRLHRIHREVYSIVPRDLLKRDRALLDEHYVGSTPAWSELEEAMLALVRRARLPQPEVNAWIVLPDGEPAIRGDFVWRAQRVVVETDGHRTHGTRQAFEYDRRRDQRLTRFAWRPLRSTWRQIMRRPGGLEPTPIPLLGQL